MGYWRICTTKSIFATIEIPPLASAVSREDIPLLVASRFPRASVRAGAESKENIFPKAIELLVTTDWPGNVRQLFDLVKQERCSLPGQESLTQGILCSSRWERRAGGSCRLMTRSTTAAGSMEISNGPLHEELSRRKFTAHRR